MEPNMICHLNEKPYRLIESGVKTIELRVNDEKRRKLKVGDLVEFINRETEESIYTIVKGLHQYKNFKELYPHFTKEAMGYLEDEEAKPEDMDIYYPPEEQEIYGVVAIEIEKV